MTTDIDLKRAVRAATTADLDLAELGDAVSRRAADAGLLDLAYAEIDSPLGPLLAVSTPAGLVHLGYPNRPRDAQLEQLAERISPRIVEAPGRLDEVRRELDEYFEGRRHDFDVKVDLSLIKTPFSKRLLEATARIPFGETRTYRDMAAAAGNAAAVRAAGNALGHNPIPIVVPCHRVLRTGGNIGGYTGGLDRKVKLLATEGIEL